MNKIILYLIGFAIFLTPFNAKCDNFDVDKKLKFGKLEPSEFNLKPTGKDTSASALVLFDVGDIVFSINHSGRYTYKFTKHTRIKILNQDGYDYANFEVPIYKSLSLKEILSNVSVASYNLKDGKSLSPKL